MRGKSDVSWISIAVCVILVVIAMIALAMEKSNER